MEDKLILCVDDDDDDRSLLHEIITCQSEDFRVTGAINGSDALRYLSTAKERGQLPCLIILDLNMPILDGKQTFQKIRDDQELHDIPLVVYTSSANPADRSFFQQHGVRFLTKPMTMSSWRKVVQEMLQYC